MEIISKADSMEDTNYCLLEFATEEAVLWIDGNFIKVGREFL